MMAPPCDVLGSGLWSVLGPSSCSGAPCEIVKSVRQRPMHGVRILRGQNFLPPGFQARSRRAGASVSHLQRPAEMFARMAQTHAQAVMTADLVIERVDIG